MSDTCLPIWGVPRAIHAVWSDADLVAAAMEDDTAAFSRLVSRHRDAVLRSIRRYVGAGSEEALDVLQDTFFSAWGALAQYERDRPFLAWIRTIALNKCRDRARRAALRAAISRSWNVDDMQHVADSTPGPADLLESEQTLARLLGGLTQLSSSLREPLLLTALEGMSHLEAGDSLGISAKAVEMRVYRARVRLEGLMREPESA
jgi:RNA polymerase sigma factor CnrH